ncbi:hypothetical protein [Actinomadura sp. KC216]|uniref:hypothetical protein n=1 Tax=Actinomadura sp. KC216 TaxID=2530370 RepID=UPI0010443985|nr:hypothetical protein [Actinomadura sp. KC216]
MICALNAEFTINPPLDPTVRSRTATSDPGPAFCEGQIHGETVDPTQTGEWRFTAQSIESSCVAPFSGDGQSRITLQTTQGNSKTVSVDWNFVTAGTVLTTTGEQTGVGEFRPLIGNCVTQPFERGEFTFANATIKQ